MNNPIKIGIYAVLLIAVLWCGGAFYSEFKRTSAEAEQVIPSETNEVSEANTVAVATNAPDTNVVSTADTNAVPATNQIVSTNAAVETTNAVAAVTNAPTNVSEAKPVMTATGEGTHHKKVGRGKMMAYMGAFLGLLIILGLLVAYDVTQFLGNKTVDLMFNEDLKGVHDPDYEEIEALYQSGKPLDAIQAMREYLKKNPRQQHVAIRIAEIYEKDLHNDLAAALEYEQILTQKLPRERWGWAAIHLCNLYSKSGKTDKAVALLNRINEEYNETAAAKKARKRLAMFESAGSADALRTDAPEDPRMPDVAPAPKPAAAAPPAATPKASSGVKRVEVKKKKETKETKAPEESDSSLPPGFRPKK